MLITGAGGSIGSEIARQVAAFEPAQLLLLDHDETHLHDVAVGPAGRRRPAAGRRRRPRRGCSRSSRGYRPDVVFHAAAHKHVPVLEEHPVEAARVNVLGTLNVVEAAAAAGVERFVLISTDKAVRPTSVMGASQGAGRAGGHGPLPRGRRRYCAVRFGNVLGSRGSVIPTFARQIADGGPVTVTDPRMTRFFMSVQEAVQLVLQASVLSDGGEIFMLEMGQPVRILDLAERMIRLSGLRAGHRHRDRDRRAPAGREAPRGALRPRRGGASHDAPLDPAARPGIATSIVSSGLPDLRAAVEQRDGERRARDPLLRPRASRRLVLGATTHSGPAEVVIDEAGTRTGRGHADSVPA